jgi:hypothetical protein
MPPSPPGTAGPPSLTVTIVIAARNEQHRLPRVLAGLPPVDEVIVVDGGSADDTVAVARAAGPHVRVVRQTRTGRGNALACGFAAASGDVVATLPADGTADPGELPRYIAALRAGAEAAHGSRFRPGGTDRAGGRLTRLGYALLARLVNLLVGARLTDPAPGWHAYWRAVLPVLDLPAIDRRRPDPVWGDGPEIGTLLAVRAAAQGLRVVEVPSVGYPPVSGRAARRRPVRALRTVLREWRRSRRGLPVPPRSAPARRPYGNTSAARYDAPAHGAGPRFPANSGSLYDTLTGIGYDRSAAPHETTGGVRYPTSAPPPAGPAAAPPFARPAGGWPDRERPAGWPDRDHLARDRPVAGRHAVPGDPAVHRLDPGDSGVHHLRPADSGVHHLDPRDRRHRAGVVYGSGPGDTSVHDWDEPDQRLLRSAPPREVGGGRRRLESRDRPARRPDLTVIPGEGDGPHLRALPGDRHRR